jgi:hypothetical protein
MILALLLSATSFGVAGLGCEQKAPTEAAKADAGNDKYVTADSKLTKALQAAASSGPAADKGPPPEGVFAVGAADQRHRRGAPTKVELINDGAEPKISLGGGPDAGAASLASSLGPAVLELGLQMGPRVALPTVDLALVLTAAKGAEGEAPTLVGDVKQALPAKDQPGELPPEAEHEIGTLASTQVVLQLTADGRESDATFKLSKGAPVDLDRFGELAAQTLVLATVPQPPGPVGVGAQWIGETRMAWSGVDVLAYRAFRVKSIDGARLTLTIDVKAYAADPNTEIQGVPKGATLEQFDGQAQGEMQVVRGEVLARSLNLDQRVVMIFRAPSTEPAQPLPGRPEGNMLTAQLGGQAKMVRGEDLRGGPRRRGDARGAPSER